MSLADSGADGEGAEWKMPNMTESEQYHSSELDSTLDSRRDLRDEVLQLVAKHSAEIPPPFTSPEMIVMAIIDSQNKYCSREDIVE